MSVKLDWRYRYKSWPKEICAKCPACSQKYSFRPAKTDNVVRHEYRPGAFSSSVEPLPPETVIAGAGMCAACGKSVKAINWPQDAYYCFVIADGSVWGWDEAHLRALGQWVEAKIRDEANFGGYLHFLSNLPAYIVKKKNREEISKKIAALLAG